MENIDNQFVEKMNVRILDNLMNQSEYTPYCGVFFVITKLNLMEHNSFV